MLGDRVYEITAQTSPLSREIDVPIDVFSQREQIKRTQSSVRKEIQSLSRVCNG
jgi:hypothetical protein